jgi:hypothetical protein
VIDFIDRSDALASAEASIDDPVAARIGT